MSKVIVSGPGVVFAARMAARREPGVGAASLPLSSVVNTTDGRERPSRASRRGRNRLAGRRGSEGRDDMANLRSGETGIPRGGLRENDTAVDVGAQTGRRGGGR